MKETNSAENQYLGLLRELLDTDVILPNRTAVDCKTIFGRMFRFDLSKGFPILTTKKVFFKGVVIELLWFISGDTNIKYLVDHGVNIWNDDAYRFYLEKVEHNVGRTVLSKKEFIAVIKESLISDEETSGYKIGDLGPVYGEQWRSWSGETHIVDQLKDLTHRLKDNPSSRRHILSAWNVGQLDSMALPPCHLISMFAVVNGKLNCNFIIRSNDAFLGMPYNIASYALLTHMIAQVVGLDVGELVYFGWNIHLYINHIDAATEQISRIPRDFPELKLNSKIRDIDMFKFKDISIENYNPHPTIKAELVT